MANKLEALSKNLRQELIDWYIASKKVDLFICGKSGAGKTSLASALFGENIIKHNIQLKPDTAEVSGRAKTYPHGVKVTVWDSPGLKEDGDAYLAAVQDGMKNHGINESDEGIAIDLWFYCVNALETRITLNCKDVVAMKKLTIAFGKNMWKYAVFVLTFANVLECADSDILCAKDAEKPSKFKSKLQLWENTLRNVLVEQVGVERAIADDVRVIPAGVPHDVKLLDRDDWLRLLWFEALDAMKTTAQPAMMKVILVDPTKFGYNQPSIFSKHGARIGKKLSAEAGLSEEEKRQLVEQGEKIGSSIDTEITQIRQSCDGNMKQVQRLLEDCFSLQPHPEALSFQDGAELKG